MPSAVSQKNIYLAPRVQNVFLGDVERRHANPVFVLQWALSTSAAKVGEESHTAAALMHINKDPGF